MANDSVAVNVTSKNLKRNKAKVTLLGDFKLRGGFFDLSLFPFPIQGEQGGATQ